MKSSTTRTLVTVGLKTIGVAGLAGVAIVAPNALSAMEGLLPKRSSRQSAQKTLFELKRQGLVIVSKEEDKLRFQLTSKGLHRLQAARIEELEIPAPRRWDKRWRMVMFDVPIRHNQGRARFTNQLNQLGFYKLRDSTWIYPYPCFDQLEEITKHFQLQRFVTYAEVDRLDQSSLKRLLHAFPALQS